MKDKTLSEKKECVAIFGNQFLVYPEKDVKEAIALVLKDMKERAEEEKECMSNDKYAEQELEHINFLEGLEFARVRILKRFGEDLA